MQKVLITGSTGYIGSCCYEFFKKKYKVFGIDVKISKIKKQKNFYRCNLTHKNKLNKIIKIIKPYRDWETDRKSTRLNSSH